MSGAGKRPEIERGPLRELLLDSLQPGTVEWDCKLESGEVQGEQVLLRFAGGNRHMQHMTADTLANTEMFYASMEATWA